MLADVAGLGGEDDRRVALEREQDVRVAVHDREAAHVRDGALEAAVLGAAHEHRVEAIARERFAYVGVAAGHLVHDASNPFTSAQTASFRGAGTPSSRPKRAI